MTVARSAKIALYKSAWDVNQNKENKRIPFRGGPESLPVLRVRLDDLTFNPQLGRLILEREGAGATLKTTDDELQKLIEKHILDQKETKELRSHLAEEKQLEPGIIAADGTVINGNRRLATLRSLFSETKETDYEYMNVALLPADATPAEMYLLEVNLQMTPETRARYGPFTALVQLRFGLQVHKLDQKQIANAMYLEEEDIKERLEILGLADQYLAFVKQPRNYRLLERGFDESDNQGKYEHFVTLLQLKKKHGGLPYWEALLLHAFQMIRGDCTYRDLRELKKWTVDDIGEFAATIEKSSGITQIAAPPTTPVPQPNDLAGLASDLGDVQSTMSGGATTRANALKAPSAPTSPGGADIDVSVQLTVEAVNRVNDLVEARKHATKPLTLLTHVQNKLEIVAGILKTHPTVSEEVRARIRNIQELAEGLSNGNK